MLGGQGEPEEAELADLHAGVELDRQGCHVGQLEGDVPGEARVDEAGRRVGEQTQTTQRGLALDTGGDVVGQRAHLVRRAEHELARVQDERLVPLRLDHPGQVGLVGGRVDVGVAVVLEDPEEPVEPDVDRRRLQHLRLPGLHHDPALVDLAQDVAVAQQHRRTLPAADRSPVEEVALRASWNRPCATIPACLTSIASWPWATRSPRASVTRTRRGPTASEAGPTGWPRCSRHTPTTSATPTSRSGAAPCGRSSTSSSSRRSPSSPTWSPSTPAATT